MTRSAYLGIMTSIAAVCAFSSATPGNSQQSQPGALRCGWLHNPTPGNYWLTDRDGNWILSTQGGREVPGMERMPDMSTGGFVRTNGNYGYSCACVRMTTNARRDVIRIHSARPLPLARCRSDRTLPRP